jgi:hypothetical protein
MLSLNVRSAQVRRALVAVVIAAVSGAASAPRAQEAADTLKFTNESGIVLNLIKPEKAADFEAVWKQIRTKLSSLADKPELKALGDNLKIYKVDAPPNPQTGVTYLFICDPVSKAQSYNPTKLLFESGAFTREEADGIFAKLKDCYNQIVPWPLVKIG